MDKWIKIVLFLLLAVMLVVCNSQESPAGQSECTSEFNPESLNIPEKGGRKIRGQILYMPVYSNIPYQEKKNYKLSNFLAVHNTDLKNPIKITNVIFFNTEGKKVKDFFSEIVLLNPLATLIVTISQKDQSGTGDSFLVEWMADQPVNEPLIESVMKDLSGNLGMSFLSTGRVIREIQ